jgi:Tol biopolymer transport system component
VADHTPTVTAEGRAGPSRSSRPTLAVLLLSLATAACEAPAALWWEASVPEPTVFAPGVISSDLRDYDIAFTPDGREAYFTRRSRRGPPRIFVTTYSDSGWTAPTPAPFGSERDEGPYITADGSTMLFSSRRPAPGQAEPSDDIWIMYRQGTGWSEPQPVAGPVNRPSERLGRYTLGAELGPSLLPDGGLLYWARTSPEWGGDLYVALPDDEGGFRQPSPLRVNSQGEESDPVVSPGGRYILFQAYRDASGYGEQDLYAIERTRYGWSDPILLPEPINSVHSEGWPSFSPDGKRFFFASDRDARPGYYDIYWVNVEALGLIGLGDGAQ